MFVIYNINLDTYLEAREKDYLRFTSVELSNNLLSGRVAFVDEKKDNSIVFEAELLKFFIDLHDALIEAKGDGSKIVAIYSLYQSYMFEIGIENKNIHLIFNKVKKFTYNCKDFIDQVNQNRGQIYKEYKILYPDYEKIENGSFLVKHFE